MHRRSAIATLMGLIGLRSRRDELDVDMARRSWQQNKDVVELLRRRMQQIDSKRFDWFFGHACYSGFEGEYVINTHCPGGVFVTHVHEGEPVRSAIERLARAVETTPGALEYPAAGNSYGKTRVLRV